MLAPFYASRMGDHAACRNFTFVSRIVTYRRARSWPEERKPAAMWRTSFEFWPGELQLEFIRSPRGDEGLNLTIPPIGRRLKES
jgi:hypothetical protein